MTGCAHVWRETFLLRHCAICGKEESARGEIDRLSDHLDLMVDEFKRIMALTHPTALRSNSEIYQLCERAIKNTKQKVPVIEQRDKAKAELAALKEKFEARYNYSKKLEGQRDSARQKIEQLRGLAEDLANYTDCWPWYWLVCGEKDYCFGVVAAFPLRGGSPFPTPGSRLESNEDGEWIGENGTAMLTENWITVIEQQNGDAICRFIAKTHAEIMKPHLEAALKEVG